MHAIEYTCVRTNTRSALSDEFNFRVFCVLFDIVLMCGMSHERDVSDISNKYYGETTITVLIDKGSLK